MKAERALLYMLVAVWSPHTLKHVQWTVFTWLLKYKLNSTCCPSVLHDYEAWNGKESVNFERQLWECLLQTVTSLNTRISEAGLGLLTRWKIGSLLLYNTVPEFFCMWLCGVCATTLERLLCKVTVISTNYLLAPPCALCPRKAAW